MRSLTPSLWLTWVAIALAVSPCPAQAQYLDPGAASILVQAVIAVTVGVAAAVKLYWRRISSLFLRWRRKDTDPKSHS